MTDSWTPDKRSSSWRSSNPRFGVVRKVLADSGYAIVLDDLNGDYREIELTDSRHAGPDGDDLFLLDDAGYPDEDDDGRSLHRPY